ncbi:MAG TPA: addiction module protein [Pirellulales bacterium]|nr:addiction module protein [Pirellulales bacterium]
MIPNLHELGIDKLSTEDRIALAQAIWDSIEPSREPLPLTDAQRQEVERRLVDHQRNPDDVVPWEVVKANALAKLDE